MSQFPSQKEKLTESNGILAALQEIATRIGFLSAVRGIAADLRVTLLGGTLGTVTTVTTVSTVSSVTVMSTLSNQTSIGGHNAALTVLSQVNNLAVIGNINNIY